MFRPMFLLLLLVLTGACSLFQLAAPDISPTPTIESPTAPPPDALAVTPNTPPSILLTADRESVMVGDVITVQARTINLGMPQYTFSLNPGVTITVPYGNSGTPSVSPTQPNAPFEIISTAEELASGLIRLRAVSAGNATLTASASGEARSPEGAFYWSHGASNPLTLIVIP